MSGTPALLRVEGLTVEIATPRGTVQPVRGIDLAVRSGETLGLVGESGCGKSLTALALMELLPPRAERSAARLDFDGIDLLDRGARAIDDLRGRRIAMIFQEPMTALNPAFTIGRQLGDVLRRHRDASEAEARDRALHLLARVGISAPATRLAQYPHELSGGLRQRVLIAMALMCGPDLIIADEPTTALDVTIQAELLHLLAELQRELGMAMILITHDLGIVSRIADRVAVMYAGEIVETGPVEAIFDDPLHPYTQALMACLPIPGRTARLHHLPSIPGAVPARADRIVGCVFRNRCRYARDACRVATVPLTASGNGHAYRCVMVPEEARAALSGTPA